MTILTHLVQVYAKLNINLKETVNWETFKKHGHESDLECYIACLRNPDNPCNCIPNYPNKKLDKHHEDKKSLIYSKHEIEHIKDNYKFHFDSIIYVYLTEVSKTMFDYNLTGSIWGNPNTYDGIFSCDCKDDLCDEDNCYCSFKKYTLLFPSILDLFIVTYYYRYNSVCRWNG